MPLGNIIDTNYDFEQLPDLINLAGVSFEGRQDIIMTLKEKQSIYLVRDPFNEYDKYAIKVFIKRSKTGDKRAEKVQIGFIPKKIAEIIAPEMDAGLIWRGKIGKVIGNDMQTKGVLVNLYCENS